MKFLGRMLLALLLLANLSLLAALSIHLIRWPGGFALVSKDHLTLIDTYADTRNWSPQDLAAHAPLASRITQAGQARTIEHLIPATASADKPAATHAPAVPEPGAGSALFDMTKKQ